MADDKKRKAAPPAPAEETLSPDAVAPADESGGASEVEPATAQAPEAEAASAAAPEAEPAAADAPEVEAEQATPAKPKPSEPAETLHPKERRRRARSTHAGDANPAQSAEERQAARAAARAEKAKARRVGRPKERAKAKQRRTAAAGGASIAPAAHEHGPGRPKTRQGVVVSDKGEKTIRVRIDTSRRHRRYKKIVRSSATLHVHDERNEAGEGDLVRVVETRPLSRTKRWRLTDILERAR